jgi:histidinol-phosphate aminotransferase
VLQAQVALLRRERDSLAAWLLEEGLRVAPSDANFLLFGTFPDRDEVWRGLLARDVLVRQTGPEGWLRVSIGTPEENDKFRSALRDVLGGDHESQGRGEDNRS